jgi:hypothetical protein
MSEFHFTWPATVALLLILAVVLAITAYAYRKDQVSDAIPSWSFMAVICVALFVPGALSLLKEQGINLWVVILAVSLSCYGLLSLWRKWGPCRSEVAADGGPRGQVDSVATVAGSNAAHVLVRKDGVQVTNLRTGTRVSTTPRRPYATDRAVVAEFEPLEEALKFSFGEAGLRDWWRLSPKVRADVETEHAEGPTELELRAVQEACLGAGARMVTVRDARATRCGSGDRAQRSAAAA